MKKIVKRVVVALFLAALLLCSCSCTRAPKPEIKNGEFDFSVTYELNGETKTISGTYVCEFVGVSWAMDGYSREWNGYIKDSDMTSDVEIYKNGDETLCINLDLSCKYFMSDPHYISQLSGEDIPDPTPSLYVMVPIETEWGKEYTYSDDISAYDVRIVEYSYAKPIENVYK